MPLICKTYRKRKAAVKLCPEESEALEKAMKILSGLIHTKKIF
jgi:uncharacterized protein (DUF2384 family)